MSARWPSRYPVWTLGALGVAALLFCAQLWVQYAREWSEAERLYLGDYRVATANVRHFQMVPGLGIVSL